MPNVQTLQVVPITDVSDQKLKTNPIWINWFGSVFRFLKAAPTISHGIVTPTSTPAKIGDIYIDTVLAKIYVSTGVTGSGDWKILN